MLTYLRFTRQEFEAIAQVCRPIQLNEETFPALRHFLVESLGGTMPVLSGRIAGFRKYQVGIIYRHLKEHRAAEAERGQAGECDLSFEELEALTEACRDLPLRGRFLGYARDILVHHFRVASPGLAGKLARLSDGQFEGLCERVRGQQR